MEDDPFSRAYLTALLKRSGYRVVAVEDGGAAISTLTALGDERPALILTDIDMPHVSGFNLLSELRSDADRRDVPVIFLTSAEDSAMKVAALDFGANDYITKPIDEAELTARIRAQLRTSLRWQQLRERSSPQIVGDAVTADQAAVLATPASTRADDTAPTAPTAPRASGGNARELPPGHVLAGRYQIIETLGSGGMGTVYRVRDFSLDAVIAIKVVHPHLAHEERQRARLRNEVRVARLISHDNACRLYDLVDAGDVLFLTMEHIEGETLSARLKRDGSMSPERAIDILRDVASALAAAHRKQIIHRDLKPSNVLITPEGRAIVLDFGLAHLAGTERFTASGVAFGTPAYMAPEQFECGALDGRTDVYALGLLAYEILTGFLPLLHESLSQTASMRVRADAPPLREVMATVPAPLEALVARCLRCDPAARFADAAEFLRALDDLNTEAIAEPSEAAAESAETAAEPASPSTDDEADQPEPPGRGGRWLVLALGVALGAALATGAAISFAL